MRFVSQLVKLVNPPDLRSARTWSIQGFFPNSEPSRKFSCIIDGYHEESSSRPIHLENQSIQQACRSQGVSGWCFRCQNADMLLDDQCLKLHVDSGVLMGAKMKGVVMGMISPVEYVMRKA